LADECWSDTATRGWKRTAMEALAVSTRLERRVMTQAMTQNSPP
jgi:hypothetical protein